MVAGPGAAPARSADRFDDVEDALHGRRCDVILDLLQELARDGAAALSLRSVARELDMVSSGIYRYVESRDALLTLLIIAGYTTSMNYDLFSDRMMSLPVFVYNQYANPGSDVQPYLERAWAGALTLILIVMALNLIARLIARIFSPKLGR